MSRAIDLFAYALKCYYDCFGDLGDCRACFTGFDEIEIESRNAKHIEIRVDSLIHTNRIACTGVVLSCVLRKFDLCMKDSTTAQKSRADVDVRIDRFCY